MPSFAAIKKIVSANVGLVTGALVLTVGFAGTASAQALRTENLSAPTEVLVEGEASNAETVFLLNGLGIIERDLMLGMLFLQDGLTSTVGSHFTHPRKETWPLIKDGLAAAGIADFEGLLVTLEGETDPVAINEAHVAVVAAVIMAESALNASEQDKILAIYEGVRTANDQFNTSGPTEAVKYQEGWASLMIVRGKIDILLKSPDPAVAKAAMEMGKALDDVILALPDPAVTAPVDFDPAPVAEILGRIEGLVGAV